MHSKKLLLATVLLALSSTSVYAEGEATGDGVIHFTGNIVNASCVIDGDSGGKELTVALGTFPITDFAESGMTSPPVDFDIKLKDCPVKTDGLPAVQLTFEGATVSGNNTILALSGADAATGIGIVVNYAGTALTLDGSADQVAVDLPDVAGSGARESFTAHYKSTSATVTAGPANADLTVNILYK